MSLDRDMGTIEVIWSLIALLYCLIAPVQILIGTVMHLPGAVGIIRMAMAVALAVHHLQTLTSKIIPLN